MKHFIISISLAITLTACATSPSKSDGAVSEAPRNAVEVSESERQLASKLYSNDEIMKIMFGTGKRDPDKLAARLKIASAHRLGSEQNPVRTHMPQGERAYLMRLRCPNGKAPEFERAGSFGAGPYETILDGYELKCDGLKIEGLVYMDMYHPGYVEEAAIPGFSIR